MPGKSKTRRPLVCLILIRVCSQPSIDIEAKVDNGYLGVGVFAPGDMLTESDADGVVRDIKSMLMSIS